MVQNVFQLSTAYSSNEVKFPVFGCVTTMDDFVFLRYDGEEFVASTRMSVNKGAITEGGLFERAILEPRSDDWTAGVGPHRIASQHRTRAARRA